MLSKLEKNHDKIELLKQNVKKDLEVAEIRSLEYRIEKSRLGSQIEEAKVKSLDEKIPSWGMKLSESDSQG